MVAFSAATNMNHVTPSSTTRKGSTYRSPSGLSETRRGVIYSSCTSKFHSQPTIDLIHLLFLYRQSKEHIK